MGDRGALHAVVVQLVGEDAGGVAVEENLGHDLGVELGMALDGDVRPRAVHALDGADVIGAERDGVGREVEDDVAVHLVDALEACEQGVLYGICESHGCTR